MCGSVSEKSILIFTARYDEVSSNSIIYLFIDRWQEMVQDVFLWMLQSTQAHTPVKTLSIILVILLLPLGAIYGRVCSCYTIM